MRPWIKWIAALSITLNIIFVGFVAGKIMHGPWRDRELRDQIEALSPEKQKLFDHMREQRKARRDEDRDEIMQLRKEMIEIMEAPTFDKEKFIDKSQELNALFAENKEEMLQDMVELAKQSTQEERRILAKHLRKPPSMEEGRPPKHFGR